MITFRRLCKLGEFAIAPVIVTGIYNNAADGCSVTADPFSGRFNHDISTPVYWPEKIPGSAKSIIHNKGQIIFFCQLTEFLKIRDIQAWVADSFEVNGLGV